MAGTHEGVFEDGVLATCGICGVRTHMLDPEEMDWICDPCSTAGWTGFTSAYMVHQEFEELEVMPALSAAVSFDDLLAIDMAIIATISPEEMVYSATLMLPAMNVEDRVELVGGMREGMPPEVFAGVWGLIEGVLAVDDFRQLASRLGIA